MSALVFIEGDVATIATVGLHILNEELSIRAQLLEEGGPAMWETFMAELRTLHLDAPASGASVLAGLQAAYEAVVARKLAAAS